MKINILEFLALALLATSASCQLGLNCRFENVGWDDVIQPAFTCTTQNLNLTKPKTLITTINGTLPDGATIEKVNTFLVFEQICEYFPVGIDNIFKQLEGIAIQKSQLKKITKTDLKPFSELKSISLFGNMLTSLENRLFVFNPKLKLISLFSNQLKHIFPNVFDELHDLDRVYMTFNPCINENGQTKENIEHIKSLIADRCTVSEEMEDFALLEKENQILGSNLQKLEENFNAVTKNMIRTQKQLEKFSEDLKKLKTSNESYHCPAELTQCEVDKLDLMELLKDMKIVEIVCESSQTQNCDVVNLKVLNLDISVTSVRSKDKSLLDSNKITELTVEHQQILHLPLNLSDFMPKLEKLAVTNSGLITIEEKAFKGLNVLSEIDLSKNKLTDVRSANFEHVENLVKLDLSHNSIEELEVSTFDHLKMLKELRLNNNLLMKISSEIFSQNKELEFLTLNNNKLRQIASNFFEFSRKSFQLLDLTQNVCIDEKYPDTAFDQIAQSLNDNCVLGVDLECEFEQKDKYTCTAKNLKITSENIKIVGLKGDHMKGKTNGDVAILYIHKQTMKFIPANIGNFMTSLQSLNVEGSKLKIIKDTNFVGLGNIKDLTIKDNQLTQIDSNALKSLLKLETLDLSQNLIVSVGESFVHNLKSLKIVNLSNNKLTNLTTALVPPKNVIEKFICSHNLLSSIDPQIIKRLKSAHVIDFESNSCIDSKFDKLKSNNKKLMELFGEISFKCSDV